jgi:tetratricopeptide (TPR) repeat protein
MSPQDYAPFPMKYTTALLMAVLSAARLAVPLSAEEVDQTLAGRRFDMAYRYIQNADEARNAGETADATILYQEAVEKYQQLAKDFKDWQPEVVKFRIQYCQDQLSDLEKIKKNPSLLAKPAAVVTNPPALRKEEKKKPDLASVQDQASRLLKEGNAQRAHEVLLEGIRADPDNRAIRLLMAIAQCQKGAYEDAVFILTPLLEETPKNAMAHAVLGVAHAGAGRMKEARTETDTALQLDPECGVAHFNMAQLLAQEPRPDLAKVRNHYDKSMALGGTRDARMDELLKKAAPKPASKPTAPAP